MRRSRPLEYSNRPIPEGINTSETHPLKELIQLLTVVTIALVGLFWLLGLAADYLVGHVPFEYEQGLGDGLVPDEVADGEIPGYLRGLTQDLAARMDLPEGMSVQVHYVDEPVVNAFATLGGQLVVYRGLLERMPNENALAMVLAHEIAHVKLRHPLRSLGRGMVLAVAIAAMSGAGGNTLGGYVVGETGTLTVLGFSRDQEEAADAEGLQAVVSKYGHGTGSQALFRVLLEQERKLPLGAPQVEFLRTHPLGEERIEAMSELADEHHWSLQADTTPLPSFIPRSKPSHLGEGHAEAFPQ